MAPTSTSHGSRGRHAFATLLTSSSYVPGAIALARSLSVHAPSYTLYVLAPAAVSSSPLSSILSSSPNVLIRHISPVPNPYRDAHERYKDVFAKLQAWRMHDVADVVVFLDADTVVTGDIDELFSRPTGTNMLAAAPDIAAADLFNAGVMAFVPDSNVADELFKLLSTAALPAYDTGDQGFLNAYFAGWYTSEARYRLPLVFNAPVELAIREPAYFQTLWDARKVRVVHYWGSRKPWHFWRCFDAVNPCGDGGGGGDGDDEVVDATRVNDARLAVRQNKLRKLVGDVHFDLLVTWWTTYLGRDVRVSAADALRQDDDDDDDDDD
ncbi:glycosyltransferase family 8 protein [Pseudoscourfieldia marina]